MSFYFSKVMFSAFWSHKLYTSPSDPIYVWKIRLNLTNLYQLRLIPRFVTKKSSIVYDY